MHKRLTFADVLIEPQFSELETRREVDVSTRVGSLHLPLPVVSANMATITEVEMARKLSELGGLALLHRFSGVDENVSMYRAAVANNDCAERVGVSIGVKPEERDRAAALHAEGARIFCVDVAHGAQISTVRQAQWLREHLGDDLCLIVGNFGTVQTIRDFEARLEGARVDVYKVGIGPGAACSTRIKTGVGVPQLSAILECAAEYEVIADGGCRSPGDVCKSLAAGARAVMIGYLLAGTNETPGLVEDGAKVYAGSASGGYASGWKTSEGVRMRVPCRGPVDAIVRDVEGGLRSSLTYAGSASLEEFREKASFMEVSAATASESAPVSA
jgi:IMP dehydrogenase